LHIKHRLTQRLILCVNNLAGLLFIASAQAGSVAGFGVHAVESPIADTAPYQAVTCFHTIFHATAKIDEADSAALLSSGRVTARYPEFLRSTEIGVRFGVRCGRHFS
jgi:hypothetical protein